MALTCKNKFQGARSEPPVWQSGGVIPHFTSPRDYSIAPIREQVRKHEKVVAVGSRPLSLP